MRIVHICLACFYIDGMGYQENILPKYHSKDHEVLIITSDFAFDASGKRIKKEKKEYLNEYGIPVKVLEKNQSNGFSSRYGAFLNLFSSLEEFKPDIIFCHGGQFVSLADVIRYCKENKAVKLFIDQHGDYFNTPVNTLKRRLGQYMIYGHWMRKAQKYTQKFWGVTPWRCEYLKDVYKLSEDKIDFLPMGGDDEKIDFANQDEIRKRIRNENNISDTDFLVVTGGKLDSGKKIDILMKAVFELNDDNLKLLVFGKANEETQGKINELSENKNIRYIGWVPSDEVYNYFLAADLVFFPGTHSVLWEQACACGVPCVFHDWENMHHVDVGGNAAFIKGDTVDEMKQILSELHSNKKVLLKMKAVAQEKAVKVFSYREIARKAIFEDK